MITKGKGSVKDRQPETTHNLKCPECHAQLKKRRSRRSDKCEMVCGGCGRVFDICDLETLEKLDSRAAEL
jgi:Trm112p-like protein